MAIKLHKFASILSTGLWTGLGVLTIGSIAVSSIGWVINLGMGLLFILIGSYLYIRGKSLTRFYAGAADQLQADPNFQRVIHLDLVFIIISCLLSSAFLIGAFIRVFFEGFAVFG